jgi:hypothetical protein
MWSATKSFSSPTRAYPTTSSLHDSIRPQIVSKWRKRFALARLPGLEAQPRRGRKARFSNLVVQVKALACELPHTLGLPLSHLSIEEVRQHIISQGLVTEISGATLWRWLRVTKRGRPRWWGSCCRRRQCKFRFCRWREGARSQVVLRISRGDARKGM